MEYFYMAFGQFYFKTMTSWGVESEKWVESARFGFFKNLNFAWKRGATVNFFLIIFLKIKLKELEEGAFFLFLRS